MPSSYVGISDDGGDKILVDSAGNISTVPAGPAGFKFYLHWLSDVPGVVASNNFISVFNPLGSGKTIIFYLATAASYTVAAASTPNSMNIYRTTAASAGTLVAAASVGRFLTADPNPVAEVRFGNPTVTVSGTSVQAFPPPISTGAGIGSTSSAASPSGASAIALPGQGIVFNTAAGDVDQVWNFGVVWAEG